jgi:hypothetical protein
VREELVAALDEASARAAAADGDAATVAALLLRVLTAAAGTAEVTDTLADVPAARALLRVTDAGSAIELQAGEGRLHAEAADTRGPGPKIDATAATWLGLLGGTLRPWLAFTRGLVVCRAGLNELRWIQTVAERLQRGYRAAREAAASDQAR